MKRKLIVILVFLIFINNLLIKEGEFKTSTVTYTTTAKDLHLGQKLGIRLVNLLQDKFSGLDFDNVRLTAEP
ncbi:MAG: hypothetical protein C6Y22_24345 [Hapalosiphonaceae cyanobacterium JJU2]|nr:MAG: hypothetical protein C6Y22_24345 [Hapalosiphonaceae cyanobacterium JJU2]